MSGPAVTIVAAVTAPVASGVGIIRLSGSEALALAKSVAPALPEWPEVRRAYLTELTDGKGVVLDQGLVLYFRGPHSFTGEDVVELQIHGSPKLLALLIRILTNGGLARLAEPGEFSRRAFLNGKLDLTRAEAIADLIAAESELAVRAASAQLRGGLEKRVGGVRQALIEVRAVLEGALDFPDEAEEVGSEWLESLKEPIGSLRQLLAGERSGRLLRAGARVVLFGPVNAGKSTLFNRLLAEERALVDSEPGTTRDLIEARWDVGGAALTLVDTAGVRELPGRLEALGIERAREAVRGADLVLLVLPVGSPEKEVARWRDELGPTPWLRIASKADQVEVPAASVSGIAVDGIGGAGVVAVKTAVNEALGLDRSLATAEVSARHASALRRALEHLETAAALAGRADLEIGSGQLGLAVEALNEVTGEGASEELLDAIFRRFCIGK